MPQIGGPDGQAGPTAPDMIASGGGNAGPQGGSGGGVEGVVSAIREINSSAQALGQQYPACAQEIQQIQALLRRCLVKASQGAPGQNASASTIPTGS